MVDHFKLTFTETVLEPPGHVLKVTHAASTGRPPPESLGRPVVCGSGMDE
jgi:hypothetical protein